MPVETAAEVPFGQFSRNVAKMLERMSRQPSSHLPPDHFMPSVNLYEIAEAYLVCVDLAGVDRETIELAVVDNRLILHGRRDVPHCPEDVHKRSHPNKRMKVHLMEIDHGYFGREVEVPEDVDRTNIHAVHRDGLLWVELPKLHVVENMC